MSFPLFFAPRALRLGASTLAGMAVAAAFWLAPAALAQSVPPPAPEIYSPEALKSLPPDELVSKVSQDLLDLIRNDPTLREGDIRRVNQVVDERVLPVINFTRMTALTVGIAWRRATPEQRDELVQTFREQLVLQYSDALRYAVETNVRVLPARIQPTDTDVVIRSEILRGSNPPVPLAYRLQKTDAGWKIYDINILGLWMVQHFRGQFAPTVAQGGVPALIDQLKAKNAELIAAGTKS